MINSCFNEAPTVDPGDVTTGGAGTPPGLSYPQIQAVYPADSATGVTRDNPGIVVVFTLSMENSLSEMSSYLELRDSGGIIPSTITANSNNTSFTITPNTLPLLTIHQYFIRIYKAAYIDDSLLNDHYTAPTINTDLTLNFDNLTAPVVTVTYAEYDFTTDANIITIPSDSTIPTFTSVNPVDLTNPVDIDLATQGGYIEFVLFDDNIPMIDPSTVDNTSVTLEGIAPATGIVGGTSVQLVTTDTDLKTYRLYISSPLDYSTQYQITIGAGGNTITDMSGNFLAQNQTTFTTETEPAPIISNVQVTNVTASTATIIWTTDRPSIEHIDIVVGATFSGPNYVAPPDNHDVTLKTSFSHTATGLASGTQYSLRISADTNVGKGTGATFDANQSVNAAFTTTTLPVNSGYSVTDISASDIRSSIKSTQVAQDQSFIFWKDDSGVIMGQYFDSSVGTVDVWDRWGAGLGSQIFSADGTIEAISDGGTGAIVMRHDGNDIYGARVYDNSYALAFNWGGGANLLIYDSTAISDVKLARSYSGFISEVTDGTGQVELNFIYKTVVSTGVTVGDHVINETSGAHGLVSSIIGTDFLELDASIITSINQNYRIADSADINSATSNYLVGGIINNSGPATITPGTFQINGFVVTLISNDLVNAAIAINNATIPNISATINNTIPASAYLIIESTDGSDIIIADGTATLSQIGLTAGTTASRTMSNVSGLNFDSTSNFVSGSVIYDTTTWAYITSKSVNANAPWTYTVNGNISVTNGNTFSIYPRISNSTVDTNVMYDTGVDFSAISIPVSIGDVVVNLNTGNGDTVSSLAQYANGILVLTDTGSFVFDTNSHNYQIFRLSGNSNFIRSGRSTAYSAVGPTVTQSGTDFTTDVAVDDILYNIDTKKYSKIYALTATTLTLNDDIFSTGTENFIIFRDLGATFVWTEGSNILGKTVSISDGSNLYPNSAATDSFNISTGGTFRNSHAISSSGGSVIVIYEHNNGSDYDIRAKKIDGQGNLLWSTPADTIAGLGILLVSGEPVLSEYLIKQVTDDGNNGAWVLYEIYDTGTNTAAIGVIHISSNGTVNAQASISDAQNPSMVRYDASNIVIVYEQNIAVGVENYKRIYVQQYNNTPSSVGAAFHVRPSGDESISQMHPKVTKDRSGGIIISWFETRYFPDIYYTLYGQRFNSSLVQQWGDDKFISIPIKDTQGGDPYQIDHNITSYGAGGGIFFWIDERNSGIDIYYQNVAP